MMSISFHIIILFSAFSTKQVGGLWSFCTKTIFSSVNKLAYTVSIQIEFFKIFVIFQQKGRFFGDK